MQEGRSRWHFCVALRAFAGYCRRVFARNSHKATRNTDSFSRVGQPGQSPQVVAVAFLIFVDCPALCPALFCRLPPSLLFCWLCPSLDSPLLPTDLWDLPSLVLPVSWEISCTSPLCGFLAKTDKEIIWLGPTHPHKTNTQHHYYFIPWEFSTPALASGLSLEFG